MIAKLQLFFTSRNYRKMCLLSIKTSILQLVKAPFLFIKAVYTVIKIYIDNPNSWDKYLSLKELENNNKIEQERLETEKLRFKFIGEVFNFVTYPLIYCIYNDANDVTDDDYKTLKNKFNVAKKNIINQVIELEKRDFVIPSEFKSIIESTNVDNFADIYEYEKFLKNFESLIDKIVT